MWYSFPRLLFCLKTFSRTCLRCLSAFHRLSSVAELCLTLCDPVDCSIPSFPVHQQLPELAQIQVNDAIQPFHPLSFPSSPALNLFQHQGLFQWVGSSHQVAKVLELQVSISPSKEYWGLISFRIDWFDLLAVQGTLKSLSRVFSSTTIWKHQFFSAQHSLWSNYHICTWQLEKP